MFLELKKHFPVRVQEWFSAAILFTWGANLVLHPDMFYQPQIAACFTGMLMIAPQAVWGFGAMICGMLRAGALYINGSWARTPMVRLMVSFISIFFFFWISVGLLKSGVSQPGLAVYPWLMIMDIYSAYRAASDVVESEHQRRLIALSESSSDVISLARSR